MFPNLSICSCMQRTRDLLSSLCIVDPETFSVVVRASSTSRGGEPGWDKETGDLEATKNWDSLDVRALQVDLRQNRGRGGGGGKGGWTLYKSSVRKG